MKHLFNLILLISFSLLTHAQVANNKVVTTAVIETHTPDLDQSMGLVTKFIKEHNVVLISQESSRAKFKADFYVAKADYTEFLTLIPSLGYLDNKKISTSSSNREEKSYELEIAYYKQQKEAYEKELKNSEPGTERYDSLWDKVRYYEKQVYNTERIVLRNQKITSYRIKITIIDETVDLNSRQVTWVNMPGAEYVFFMPEMPQDNISAKYYSGYSLKYLFTRGKSFAQLTTLKEFSDELADEDRYSELFILDFGQDFYSKYFGRGQNKFLNLYTGYTLGVIFATGIVSKQFNFFLSPAIGLELFKNKYFLFDIKTEYFVPIKENKNLRGIMLRGSFNFVF